MHISKRIDVETGEVLFDEKSPVAKINLNRLKSAKLNAGLTDKEIKYFYENYKDWESGEKPITWEELRLVAKIYHRPSFYYFLGDEVKDEYLTDYTIKELFDEFVEDFNKFREELDRRLELCSHVELDDL